MKKFLAIVITISSLSGCGQINEVQYQTYAVGLGIDYLKNKYHITLQFIDFSSLSKNAQSGGSSEQKPVWMATGMGNSIEEAFAKIHEGIQLPINLDQLNVILFGKTLLKNRLDMTLHALDTNYDIRVTGWVYGTENKPEDIFNTQVPFNYPFTASRINEPQFMQQEESTIPSISLQQLIYQYNEKTKTVVLPNVIVRKDIMKKSNQSVPVSAIDGAYIIKNKKMKKLLSHDELQGFVRVNNQSVRSLLTLSSNKGGKESAETVIEILQPKLKRRILNNGTKYGLDIKLAANVREASEHLNSQKIKDAIEKKVRNEVYSSYFNTSKVGGDIFQLEDYMYRYRYRDWLKAKHKRRFPTLKKGDIHIKILPLKSTGQFSSNNSFHKSLF